MTKAFIFDLDGVIVDTAKYHYLAWKKIAEKLNINFTPQNNELLKGVSRGESLEIILKTGKINLSIEEKNQLLTEKNETYLSYLTDITENEILPGVLSVLNFLKEKKQAIALGSASKNSRIVLEKIKIISLFDTIVDGNDVLKAKPDPAVFLIAAERLKIKPEKSIVFEDSIAGIQAANIGKMTSIGIGEKSILNQADYVFKDFTQITQQFIETLIHQ